MEDAGAQREAGLARQDDIGIMNAAFVAFQARKHRLDITVIDPMVDGGGRMRVDTAEAARRVGGFDLAVADTTCWSTCRGTGSS